MSPEVKLPAQVLTYRGRRAFTTKQVAEGFGCPQNNIKNNFNRNPDRFTPGKAFHRLEGPELQAFKNEVTESDLVPKKANVLYLWTEEGVFNHAKLVNTDRAWDMYRMLVHTYFAARDGGLAMPEQVERLVKARVAQLLAPMANEVHALTAKCARLEAKVTTVVAPTHFTAAGHAKLRGVRLTKDEAYWIGRGASAYSRMHGLEIGKVPDADHVTVNTYVDEAVEPFFAELANRDALFARAKETVREARRLGFRRDRYPPEADKST